MNSDRNSKALSLIYKKQAKLIRLLKVHNEPTDEIMKLQEDIIKITKSLELKL